MTAAKKVPVAEKNAEEERLDRAAQEQVLVAENVGPKCALEGCDRRVEKYQCGHRFCSRRHYYKSFHEGDGMRARAILAATTLCSMTQDVEAHSYIDLFDYDLNDLRNLEVTMLLTVLVDIEWIVNLLALVLVIGLAWW